MTKTITMFMFSIAITLKTLEVRHCSYNSGTFSDSEVNATTTIIWWSQAKHTLIKHYAADVGQLQQSLKLTGMPNVTAAKVFDGERDVERRTTKR